MSNNIFFSIIIPTYNRSYLIGKAIHSALNQNYSSFEIIVVDDGSTDDTEAIVKEIKSEKLFYFKKENAERGAARNFGVQKSKGDYVNFLDSDDLLYPHHLSSALKLIAELNRPELFYLNYDIKDHQMKFLKKGTLIKGYLNRKLLKGNVVSCNGVFIKHEIAIRYPFNENRQLAATEDWLLWLQLASRYKFYFSNTVTSAIIQHDNRSVLNINEDSLLKRKNLLIQYLSEDSVFMHKYGSHLKAVEAHMLSYMGLHLAMSGRPLKGIYYLAKAGKKKIR